MKIYFPPRLIQIPQNNSKGCHLIAIMLKPPDLVLVVLHSPCLFYPVSNWNGIEDVTRSNERYTS